MDYIKTDEGILLKDAKDFQPRHIFECGQCFRWNAMPDGSYKGVAEGRTLRVKKNGRDILFAGTDEQEFRDFWVGYFDLERDYRAIKAELSRDQVLKQAIEFGYGIRILKQDIWETMVSFIISANNWIPRIKATVERLSSHYGQEQVYKGETYYSFPSPARLAQLTEEDIMLCGCGFRAKYVLKAARIVAGGQVDLHSLAGMNTTDARAALLCFPGIGPKVSDCIMLFSMAKLDVFPVDVWVKRVMEHYYLKRDTRPAEIRQFAAGKFGALAGVAQQYLFYYARSTMGRFTSK